ncbi:MAG: glycosyltransferase family 2 protein [Planctomycetota bacterium]
MELRHPDSTRSARSELLPFPDVRGARVSGPNCDLDIVIPLYNEQAIAPQLHQRVVAACRALSLSWRIIYVDDGSSDDTVPLLKKLARENPLDRIEILSLKRNFGQPAAILAGMRHADAAALVLMDGDLQDPPELIPQLVAEWQAGHEVVIPQRPQRKESSRLRGFAFHSFHRLFRQLSDLPIPENCGTFCLLSRAVATAIVDLPECHRFFPGLRAWVGGTPKLLSYQRPARAAGEPKQTLSRLLRYAGDGILGFSRKPALLLLQLGFGLLAISSGLGCAALGFWLSGWASFAAVTGIACGFLMVAGLQLASCGFLGDLLLRIQEQAKQRPPYLLAEHFRNDLPAAAAHPSPQKTAA